MKSKEIWFYTLLIGAALLFGALGFWLGRRNGMALGNEAAQAVEERTIASDSIAHAQIEGVPSESVATPPPDDAVTYGANGMLDANVMYDARYDDAPHANGAAWPASAQEDEPLVAETASSPYTLKRMENGLSVFYQGVALAHLDMPSAVNGETIAELEAGITFQSMEEIESWLESFDS